MTDYKSKPIPPDTLIFDLSPSRFLRPEDLTERWKLTSVAITISRVSWEETTPSTKDIDPQTRLPKVVMSPVMHFKTKSGNEFPRGMLISAKENLNALKESTGVKTVGELVGKRVTIFVSEHKKRPVLRIDPKPVTQDAPPARASHADGKNGQKETLKPQPDLPALQQAGEDVITAFTNICESAGLDTESRNAILKECGGDFDLAFNKVVETYREVLT